MFVWVGPREQEKEEEEEDEDEVLSNTVNGAQDRWRVVYPKQAAAKWQPASRVKRWAGDLKDVGCQTIRLRQPLSSGR